MDELKATLSTQEWDYVGAVLGERPYREVASIITKLNNQFASQRAPSVAPEAPKGTVSTTEGAPSPAAE